jgi:hypothetical protein
MRINFQGHYFQYYNDRPIDEKGKESTIPRPKIHIALRKSSKPKDPETNPEYATVGLVDSGADYVFIPKEIAEIIKLDLDNTKLRPTQGAGANPFPTYRTTAYLDVIYEDKRITIGEIIVLVPKENSKIDKNHPNFQVLNPILLGRDCFFDKFIITFNEYEGKLEFRY